MQLFFSPGACSLAPHIVLRETGSHFSLVKVDLQQHRTEHGADFYQINPKGQVPFLLMQDGTALGEGAVISQFIADQSGQHHLLPAAGTLARYQVMSWLNYIASEIHKTYSPLFNEQFDAAAKLTCQQLLRHKYEGLNAHLAQQPFLMGHQFSVADAYLFVVTRWAAFVGVVLDDLAHLQQFMQRVEARPAVQDALRAEGLLAESTH